MGHSHSSSHKRLKSISTSRAYECTEIVDLEFSVSDVTSSEPNKPPEMDTRASKTIRTSAATVKNVNSDPSTRILPKQVLTGQPVQAQYPKDLIVIIEHLKDVEKKITNMSGEDFFVYFPTLKDDLHNCWQKVYGIFEINVQTKEKKIEVINNIKILLRKINSRL